MLLDNLYFPLKGGGKGGSGEDIKTIYVAELSSDEYGIRRVSLSNGRYLIDTNDATGEAVYLDFGKCKGLDFGKFLTDRPLDFEIGIIGMEFGVDGNDSYVDFRAENMFEDSLFFVEVDDYTVKISWSLYM